MALAVILIGVWFAMSGSPTAQVNPTSEVVAPQPEPIPVPTPEPATTTPAAPTPTPNPVSSGVKVFTITGTNFSFSPTKLSVKKGDKVTITFDNVAGFHDFKIDEFNVASKKISGGGKDVVTFTADKTGTFEYYCSVGQHRQMGMKGTLTVTE